jgi:hypothetical protein
MKAQEARAGMRVGYPDARGQVIVEGTIELVSGGVVQIKWDNGVTLCHSSAGTLPIIRPTATETTPVPVASRDFPSQCPRCGAAAYIGFRTVEHEHGGGCR